MEKQIKKLLATSVQRSGYPFQAKIQDLIESKKNWKVLGVECSWCHKDREEFLDIIAYQQNIHLVIECKKSAVLGENKTSHGLKWPKGAPKRSFVFLCRNAKKETTKKTDKTIVTYWHEDGNDNGLEVYGIQTEEWRFEPVSHEASMCITVDIDKPKEILERELSNLVRGCHQFAKAFYAFLFNVGAHISDIFIPILVTTSPLYVLNYNPNKVSVKDGVYNLEPDELHQVPWVRFRKTLMAEDTDISDERTVIVVEACHFDDFLEQFKVVPAPENNYT